MNALQMLPIANIKTHTNVRRELGDLTELSASIKQVGILEPLSVRPNGDGWILVFGHRRLAAATATGLKQVPAIVLTDLAESDIVAVQLVENLMRLDIDPLEEADGYRRLIELGLKQKEIATKVGRSEAHVSKRLALSGLSPLTAKLLAAGTIPIDSAIGLARYAPEHQDRALAHVEKMYGKLENAAPYQLRNLGERARDEAKKVERSNKRRELTKKLKADGVAMVSTQGSYEWGQPGHPWRLGPPVKDSYRGESRVDMTAKQHSGFACHAAAVTSPASTYDTAEPKIVYLCTDPTSHMDADAKAKYKKKIAEGKRDSYAEQQRRQKAIRDEIAQARAARLPAIREWLKKDDEALEELTLNVFIQGSRVQAIAEILGLDTSKGKEAAGIVAGYCERSGANLRRAAAAAAIAVGEESLAAAAESLAGGYAYFRGDLPQALTVSAWFKQTGIELSEIERKALEAKK